jgi:hypothetical protein
MQLEFFCGGTVATIIIADVRRVGVNAKATEKTNQFNFCGGCSGTKKKENTHSTATEKTNQLYSQATEKAD